MAVRYEIAGSDGGSVPRVQAGVTCQRCNDTGWFSTDPRVGAARTTCGYCCKHDKGYWKLLKHYGRDNGKWCCFAGCGLTYRKTKRGKPVKLWIDDQPPGSYRDPPMGWFSAKTSADACRMILTMNVVEVSFDHDLGGPDEALIAAKLIEELAHYGDAAPPKWHVHSGNPPGRKNIEAALESATRQWAKHLLTIG